MDYLLRAFAELPLVATPISKAEYDALKRAQGGFGRITDFEEKFDVLMGNYIDLQSALLNTSLNAMLIREHEGALDLSIARSLVARKVLNLLTSLKLYHDALESHAIRIFGRKQPDCQRILAFAQKLTSQSPSFRFIEALRNYSQHHALPVHRLTFSHQRTADELSSTRVIPKIDLVNLYEDRRFKGIDMSTLHVKNGQFPLMPVLRKALDCTLEIHTELRRLMDPREQEWTSAFQEAIAKFRGIYPNTKTEVVIATPEILADEKDEIWLGDGPYRKYLKRKNRGVRKLSDHIVQW